MDSGSLLMSEIIDIPDDSSPSEDSCLVGVRARGERGSTGGVEGGDGGEGGEYVSFRGTPPQAPESPLVESPLVGPRARRCYRGERSNSCSSSSTATATYRSPVLRRQAMLASSCSQLELLGCSSILEKRVGLCTPLRRGSTSAAPPTSSSSAVNQQGGQGNGVPLPLQPLYLRRQGGRSERGDSDGLLPLVRSHSEPGLSSSADTVDFSGCSVGSKGVREGSQTSTDTGPSSEACLLPRSSLVPPSALLPRKGSVKAATMGRNLPLSKGPANSPLHLPKECNRSLGDLKVTRGLVARFLQRSKRNLASAAENSGNTGQGQKRRGGVEGNGTGHLPLEQVLRNSWGASQGSHPPHPHHRGHHHSHSDSRHNRHHSNQPPVTGRDPLAQLRRLKLLLLCVAMEITDGQPPSWVIRGTVHRVSPVRGGGGRKDGRGWGGKERRQKVYPHRGEWRHGMV
nr:protein FAM189B-like [Oncorhynchus nerka]